MNILGVFQQLGWGEVVIVLFIAMLLFGAKRLPEMGKSMGKGIKEFREGMKGLADDVKTGLDDDDDRPSSKAEPTSKDE